MFGNRNRQQPAPSGNGPYITHTLQLIGRCPGCGDTVCAPHKHRALLGSSGTAKAMATCGGCGHDQVPVSDTF